MLRIGGCIKSRLAVAACVVSEVDLVGGDKDVIS